MAFNNLQDTRTLWERCDLDTLSKAVLQVLINHRNSCSGLCNPGTTRIASETGMSTRSVKSRIALLTAQGVLKIVIKGTFTTPSGYAINLEGVATSECTPTGAGDSLVKDIHQTGAGDSLGVVQEAHEGSAGDAPKQISNKERNKERNKEEPLPPPSPPARRKTAFPCPEGIKPEAWDASNRIRRNKRLGSWTEYAWNLAVKQAATKGLSPQQMLDVCIEHGWGSFRAEYYKPNGGRPGSQQRTSTSSLSDEERKKLGIGFDVDYSKLDYTDGAF